jgi:hypothetical protein
MHIQDVKPFLMRFSDFSFCGHFAGHSPPHSGLPAMDTGQKKFNSRLVAPSVFGGRQLSRRNTFVNLARLTPR